MNPEDGRVHNHVAELLSAYIDGEVSPAERTLVERHLAGCPTCTRDVATLRQTVRLLRRLPAVPAPRAFTLRESQVRPARPEVWRWLLGAPALAGGVAAFLCVVTVGGIMLLDRMTPRVAEVPLALVPAAVVTATAPAEPVFQAATSEPVFAEPTQPVASAPITAAPPPAAAPEATMPPAPVEAPPAMADEFSAAGSQPSSEAAPVEEPGPVFPSVDTPPAPGTPPTPAPEVVAPPPVSEEPPPAPPARPAEEEAAAALEVAPSPIVVVPTTAPIDEPAAELALKAVTDEAPAAAARAPEATHAPQPEVPATATLEPSVTEVPEPTATDTPEPAVAATPEPGVTDVPEPTANDTPEPTPEAALKVTEGDMPEALAAATREVQDEVVAPESVETVDASTTLPNAGAPETVPPEPPAEPMPTPTPVPMAVEELQLSVKPGLIRVSGRLPLPEGQAIRAELWRSDESLEWSVSEAERTAMEAEGRFDLELRAQPDTPNYDLFAEPPASYEVRIVPVDPPAALEARIPFNTFPPPTAEP